VHAEHWAEMLRI